MNKKAQFFAIYLVLLTIFMCGLAIFIYYYQNAQVSSSLVSPVPLLELQDKQRIFEIQEREIAELAARDSTALLENFKGVFFYYLKNPEQEQFRNFLLSDTSLKTEDLEKIYSFELDGNILKITRSSLLKKFTLEPGRSGKNTFGVKVNYAYEREFEVVLKQI